MPAILISFTDGEVLYADTPEITFDVPILEATLRDVGGNSDRALLPLAGIRQLIVGEAIAAPAPEILAKWERAVFRFLDGQALRAQISPEVFLGRHGGVWQVVEVGSDEVRTLAIPYNALKGVFRVSRWDSSPATMQRDRLTQRDRVSDTDTHLNQLIRILSERESRMRQNQSRPHDQPLLRRVQNKPPQANP